MTPVEEALTTVGNLMAAARAPWWVIGGAAVFLHRPDAAGEIAPNDVDVLLDPADASAVLSRIGLAPTADGGDARFRSAAFVRWACALPVDFMAGLETCGEGGAWRAVTLRTRQAFVVGGVSVFAPEREELRALLHSFGRPKDVARAALL